MSVRQAARRLALSVPSPAPSPAAAQLARPGAAAAAAAAAASQRRRKWSLSSLRNWGRTPAAAADDGLAKRIGAELDDPQHRQAYLQRSMFGGADDGIFRDEIEAPAAPRADGDPKLRHRHRLPPPPPSAGLPPARELTALVTDPNPRARALWHRKKVIQMVRKNGRLTREERIKMSERELLHKSSLLPTSVKKLVMLSRQIAGKTLDDAIVQMTWSKKKMAAEIRYYLEEARDLAVAQRGMGLGHVSGERLDRPRKIRTKDGRWIDIRDPTRIYIAQSWVGRGKPRGTEPDYKGRGRTGIIVHPSTSFSVLLKEEKTRLREHDEAKARKAAKGPWVHLPDRPIHGQRPYYTW